MDDFASRMRAAADSPPPTRIDLDALISGELRRRRTLRWASGAAAVAAVVTLAIAAPALYLPRSGSGGSALGRDTAPTPNDSGTSAAGVPPSSLCAPLSPSPTGPQPPLQSYDTIRARPTEAVAQAVPRLTEALRVALRDVLPAGMTVESLQQGCTGPQFQYHRSRREYTLIARLTDQQGFGHLVIRLLPTGAGEAGCPFSDGSTCARSDEPDGTIVFSESFESAKGSLCQVAVYRPDGATVLLNVHNRGPENGSSTRPQPPLTIENLVQIGRTPGLTLYP